MCEVPDIRIRVRNDAPLRQDGEYVLYWMIAARRTRSNYALQRAVEHARSLQKPLLVFEALRCDYQWASDRHHRFIIDGMADNARACERNGVHYYPCVEPNGGAASGLLEELAQAACTVVTDDYPAFFHPRMVASAARRLTVRLESVDGNGLLPMRAADHAYPTAYAFRRHLQKTLPDHLADQPVAEPLRGARIPAFAANLRRIETRWPRWDVKRDPGSVTDDLAIDHTVAPVGQRGGAEAARAVLNRFIANRLSQYAELRNQPESDVTSELSPYLHFGQIAAHEVFAAVMDAEEWSPAHTFPKATGSRSGWWGVGESAEQFLDQLVTWRELGFNMCAHHDDYDRYASLPEWARRTLEEHRGDPRPYVYSLADFEAAATHDPLWNAAQVQLVREGRIHNYLRMLWGKKILEWSLSPEAALAVMIELNNKYALDGRDPNSYAGIFWCLGRYDRPWGPERPIFGKVRYMSSANTARKIRVAEYLAQYSPD